MAQPLLRGVQPPITISRRHSEQAVLKRTGLLRIPERLPGGLAARQAATQPHQSEGLDPA